MLRCSTGSRALDELLLGGIETQAVTEFYGEFGSGKSQICRTLSATARQSTDSGGMDSGVIYIDTEGTFRPERVEQIARTRGLAHINNHKRYYHRSLSYELYWPKSKPPRPTGL
jgi:DNA repair protein RadA